MTFKREKRHDLNHAVYPKLIILSYWNTPSGGYYFLVAEVGLEPHGLRVMSPTSYQLLHSAILNFT